MMALYAYRAPDGAIMESTVADTKDDAWVQCFAEIGATDSAWASRYWKRWESSKRAGRKLGYRLVRVRLVEVRS